jgi:hypothetical protein
MVTLTVGMTSFETLGQQQNTTNTTSTASNQTQGAVISSMANLTQSDFEELTDNLNAVREAIQDNDLAEAVGELGSAETELRIFMTQVGAENSPGGQQLGQVLNHINMAQNAASNNATLKAFEELNNAGTELLKITQMLPVDGDGDGDE